MGFYIKRLGLINKDGKEQLLLRNPADYKGGFWLTYLKDGVVHTISSTESDSIRLISEKADSGRLHVVLDHSPNEGRDPILRLDIEVWSYNAPILLMRHKTTNLSDTHIEDLKLYSIMDFDVGGPTSYKDDIGRYDLDSAIMFACDETPLCVAMTSRLKPDAWEIGSPVKLRIDGENRDLQKNLENGPKDIATALQWNLGDYSSMDTKSVDIVLTAATNLDEVKALIPKAWEQFDKKIQ
ncbi:hypothetical protein EU527_11430 [Candidatus Thorarchaeota archaeon]|nr:MAG: hypothetical protein EU527_11430 [Candidatus Thorarchaeota archaeon]